MLALVMSGTAQAGAPASLPGHVTITGTAGYADFTLPAATSIDPDLDGRTVKVSGGKQYVGFCLVPFSAVDRLRGMRSAPCESHLAALPELPLLGTFGGSVRLPRGRYRMYLFADGPARVSVPLSTIKGTLNLRATGKAPTAVLSLKRHTLGPHVVRDKQSTVVSATGVTWVGWQFKGVMPAVAYNSDICMVPAGEQCLEDYKSGDISHGATATSAYGAGTFIQYMPAGPDNFPPFRGPDDVYYTSAASDVDTMLAFSLTVDFSPGPPAV